MYSRAERNDKRFVVPSSQPIPAELPATVTRFVRVNRDRHTVIELDGVSIVLGGTVHRGRFVVAVTTPAGSSIEHHKSPQPFVNQPAPLASVLMAGESGAGGCGYGGADG